MDPEDTEEAPPDPAEETQEALSDHDVETKS